MLRAINKYFARKRSRKVLPTKTLFVSDKTDAEPAAVEPAGRPPSPYGFPGADFEVAFFDLARPEEYLDRSHYDGFHPGSSVLPAGHLKKEGLRALPCAMVYERDVEIIMRDGTKLYADVFRPVTDAKVSAILPYSPYGKTGRGSTTGPYNCGIDPASLSGYEKFEGPDPAEWANRGYATVNIDARGSFDSEGNMMRWGPLEAQDVHDTVKWISEQLWSNGSVGMAGNSWLAVSAINAASRDPHPALKCIAPWEGHADHYRDVMVRGGIPSVSFGNWMQGVLVGRGKMEDTAKQAVDYPLFNEYWATKRIPVENIQIPIYQTASYSSFIHTHGSIRTFREAATPHKWLRIHNAQEWADLYKPHNTDDLQRFFDRYLKGIDNGWERDTPKVRLSMISFTGKDVVERPESEYPLARQTLRKVYLNASAMSMSADAIALASTVAYEGHHLTDCLDLVYTVDRYTEIAGCPLVKLWMQCREHDDLDIHVQFRKLDTTGRLLHHLNYASLDGKEEGDEQDVNIFKFLGSTGALRASHRVSYDPSRSTVNEPFYTHERREPIRPGEIVPLEIGVWPMGMVLEAGESLVLRVAGHQLVLPEFKEMRSRVAKDANRGRHILHTGGEYDSHILLPVIN